MKRSLHELVLGDLSPATLFFTAVAGIGLGAITHGYKDFTTGAETRQAVKDKVEQLCAAEWRPNCTRKQVTAVLEVAANARERQRSGQRQARLGLALVFGGAGLGFANAGICHLRRRKTPGL